jgi:preprotein translocase subunit SecE
VKDMSEAVKSAKPKGESTKRFFRDIKSELKKVIWPQREDVIKSTGVVIGSVAVVGLFIWLFDSAIGFIVDKLVR